MEVQETLNKSLYKIELYIIKVIPYILALFYLVNTALSYFYIDVPLISYNFLNSSIIDDRHLALYVKDVIDDVDAPDGLVFNRFYADCCYKGIPIDWDEML